MNYELRPPRRGLSSNLSPELLGSIVRIEHVVFTKADPVLAWRIFSDLSLWPKFFPLYGELRWQGKPWTQGSRLRMEVRPPVNAVIDRVLTVCMPPHQIAWINHVRGYTMEQWVSIDPYQGGSRIATWVEITGGEISPQKDEDLQMARAMIVSSFDNFARECDQTEVSLSRDVRPAAD